MVVDRKQQGKSNSDFRQSEKVTALRVSKAINLKRLLVAPLFFARRPARTKKLRQRSPPAKKRLLRLPCFIPYTLLLPQAKQGACR